MAAFGPYAGASITRPGGVTPAQPTGTSTWWTNPSLEMQKLYQNVASGATQITPQTFDTLLSPADRAISASEFAGFSPQVQQWARQNPQAFVRSMLANRNPANQDLASVGAEGGYSTLGAYNVNSSGTGLTPNPAQYLQVHEGGGFMDFLGPALAIGGLALGGAGALGFLGEGGLFGGTAAAGLGGATGLASLPASVLSAAEAFGVGGGSLATTAAGLAGASGLGLAGLGGGAMDFAGGLSSMLSGPVDLSGLSASDLSILAGGDVAGAGSSGFSISNFLSKAGSGLLSNITNNPLSAVSNLASTLLGFRNASAIRGAGTDPLAGQRAGYAQQLQALMQNPSSVTNLPGYQFGLDQGIEALRRSEAAGGYRGSGNEMIALDQFGQQYAGQMYNQEATRLANLAGFNISPAAITQPQIGAQESASQLQGQALQNLALLLRQ